MAEYIPATWIDSDGKSHKLRDTEGDVIEDLPKDPNGKVLGASFVSKTRSLGHELRLVSKEYEKDAEGIAVHKPGTGIVLRCVSGRLMIKNKTLLKLLLGHNVFKDGMVMIDEEDPGGFWRATGYITEAVIHTPVAQPATTKPRFEDLDLKNLKIPEKGFNDLQKV